ncbi:MAG: ArsA family ATPase [Myxococcales bacterium]
MELLSRRVLLVTGKGGVGKTTLTAAIARLLAYGGKRVLVAEVASEAGEPSALADALGAPCSGERPVEIERGIRAVRMTPTAGHRRFLHDTLRVRLLAEAAMRAHAIRRFLTAAPAFSELGVLYRLLDLLRQKRHDGSPEFEAIVVDTPATGHALAIAELPEVLLKIVPGGPIGSAVREGLSLMTDARHTGAIVVTLPETLPVTEAVELISGLKKNKVPLTGLVVNRMPQDPFTEVERGHAERINAAEGPLFGARAMRRLERARAAYQRLRTEIDLPMAVVPDLAAAGPGLTETIAQTFRRAEARQEVANE